MCQELNEHPAFMSQFDASQPMSAAMEGLQALKYESDSQQGGWRAAWLTA